MRPKLCFMNWLRIAWCLLILWNEKLVFKMVISACHWDKWDFPVEHDAAAAAERGRVLLIADPQLVDENTYTRPWPFLQLTKFYTDLYMSRNWRHMLHSIQADEIIFLGDLFDGGREWDNATWEGEYRRFRRIFSPPSAASNTTVIQSLPGNHDIGFGDAIIPAARDRFYAHFGMPDEHRVKQWTLTSLDTISLSAADADLSILDTYQSTPSRILLSHVPFHRPPKTPCGRLREHRQPILLQKGHQYQNVLEESLSDTILHKLNPISVFSGDDHDSCEVFHYGYIAEYTIKSFSMAMSVVNPGFQLLSLRPDGLRTKLCLLPSQIHIWLLYLVTFVLTLILLFVRDLRSGYELLPTSKKHETQWRERMVRLATEVAKVGMVTVPFYILMLIF